MALDPRTKVLLLSTSPNGFGKTCSLLEALIELIDAYVPNGVEPPASILQGLQAFCSDGKIKELCAAKE